MTYQHKRSTVAGKVPVPADFTPGQLIVNIADGKIYMLVNGVVKSFTSDDAIKAADSAKLDGKTPVELPISTSTQTALNGKASLTGANFTGGVQAIYIETTASDAGFRRDWVQQGNEAYSPAVILGFNGVPQNFGSLQTVERVNNEVILSLQARYNNNANYFEFSSKGDLRVPGRVTAGTKSFAIDHPLDPANKNLLHTSIETARNEVQYSGTAQLNIGEAIVTIDDDYHLMPGTIAALSKDGVVTSLVNQSGFSPLRFEMIEQGKFKIICQDDASNDLVVWSYAAVRNDPFTLYVDSQTDRVTGNFIAEQDKAE